VHLSNAKGAAEFRRALYKSECHCLISVSLNEKGERVFLDDKSRAAELERQAAAINKFCDP